MPIGHLRKMLEEVVYVSGYVLTLISNQIGLAVISKNHQKKPLGMQTLLGKVTVLCAKVFAFISSTTIFIICLTYLHCQFFSMDRRSVIDCY